MRLKTFRGGGHPPGAKELASAKPIRTLPIPKKVVIPLHQHTGAPAKPTVEVGEHVKTGQLIGEAQGFISASVHASISGQVIAIEKQLSPLGSEPLCVIIGSDGKDEWHESIKPNPEYFRLSPAQVREIVGQAGIVGLGGAAFPSRVKLTPPKDKPIDTFILNGVECEPYLTCDHRLMLERTHDLVEGTKIIARALGVNQSYVAIEANKPDAIFAFQKAVYKEPNIEVMGLKVKYPQGAEKQLIKAVLDREVPSGGLPLDVGVVVHNVGTTLAISDAVRKGKPLVERVLSVTGPGIKDPQNFLVRIGTSFGNLIDFCGGFNGTPGKVIMGGPMMGLAQYTTDVPVVKGTSGVLVLRQEDVQTPEERTCIRCGKCIEACPMWLLPNKIADFAANNRFDEAQRCGLLDCMECGICTYVCPAKRPLVQLIKYAKAELALARKKKVEAKK
jgi:electron transport complex protein RnfC